MKKYLLLFHGYEEPTPDVMNAWGAWFAKVGDRFVDSGNPLGACREVTRAGGRDLSTADGAATGYCLVRAESMAEAEALLEGCPIITSAHVYETMAM